VVQTRSRSLKRMGRQGTTYLLNYVDHTKQEIKDAIKAIDEMVIEPINFIMSFKNLDDAAICMINRYYAEYGASFTVDNLSWLADMILQTYDKLSGTKSERDWWGYQHWNQGDPSC